MAGFCAQRFLGRVTTLELHSEFLNTNCLLILTLVIDLRSLQNLTSIRINTVKHEANGIFCVPPFAADEDSVVELKPVHRGTQEIPFASWLTVLILPEVKFWGLLKSIAKVGINKQFVFNPPPLAQARPRSQKSKQNSGSMPIPCLDKPVLACDTNRPPAGEYLQLVIGQPPAARRKSPSVNRILPPINSGLSVVKTENGNISFLTVPRAN